MNDDFPLDFLAQLLDAPGPSGFEIPAARVWRQRAEEFADRVEVDVSGNSMATLNPGGKPRVMLAGHIDEIGVIVTHVDEQGFLYFDGIGGWDPQVLVGQRILLRTSGGEVRGVIGRKPIHLIRPEEREKATKLQDLWIDVGAADRAAATGMGIRVGDPGVIDAPMIRLGGDRIASRAIDNRIGAFVVLEAIRMLKERGGLAAEVVAVATTQEEIGFHGGGARTSAHRIEPEVALAVDVTFASDAPQIEKKQTGEHRIGGGPVLGRGATIHPIVFDRLVEAAEAAGIPYTIQANGRSTSTDADSIHISRNGVATGLISVPNRYMHSPNEVVSLSDLEATSRLMAEFIARLDERTDFARR
ncbi:MAG TPA: M42 family metallopeptidase [Longimicrobiaceae bacterium]|nr:M42 family metallopeptidase [Longimicrobiaceae bacterium]